MILNLKTHWYVTLKKPRRRFWQSHTTRFDWPIRITTVRDNVQIIHARKAVLPEPHVIHDNIVQGGAKETDYHRSVALPINQDSSP